jgi:chemotaxis protein methyltransferase CheR
VHDGRARLHARLRAHITWAGYNLVTDASFNEFQAIVCRRALAQFGPLLRQRVLRLFHDSLARFGVLGIERELAPRDAHAHAYQRLEGDGFWYRRVG